MPYKKQLLDDEDGEPGFLSGGEQLKVNKEFANRFEHNKKREELHRLQAKHPEVAAKLAAKQEATNDDDDEESSSSEDEDDGYIPEGTERRIFETLLRIKRKDPAIYDSSVAFFPEGEGEEEEEGGGGGTGKLKGEKPLYLKDVLARQALEHGPDAGSSSSSSSSSSDEEREAGSKGAAAAPSARKPKAYDMEQEQLRRSFLEAAQDAEGNEGEGEGFEGVLKKRKDASEVEEPSASDEEGNQAGDKKKKRKKRKNKQGSKEPLSNLLDAYFGEQREAQGKVEGAASTDANEHFLRSFILNRGWVDQDEAGYVPTYKEIVGDDQEEGQPALIDDEEDEQHLEEMERFEATYNFRFEEPGTAKIVSHPRVIEGTVRKEDDRRKRQREAKKQRKEAEMAQHAEEIKRLKNLKKKEIEEKLALIHKVAGAKSEAKAEEEEQEEEEEGAAGRGKGGKDKKKTKKKGKGQGLGFKLDMSLLENDFDPEAWDRQMAEAFNDEYYAEEDEEAALAAGEMEDQGDDLLESEDAEERDGAGPAAAAAQQGKGHKGGLSAEERAAGRAEVAELLEEYFKLDHEGEAGGQKTRFRYKPVPANTFGLSAEDLLALDDKELNQVVGLKKLAPYREDQAKQRPNYKALQALRASGGGSDGANSWPQKKWKRAHKQPGDQIKQKGQKRSLDDEAGHVNGGGGGGPDDEKASRLASYAKLSLQKPGKGGKDGGQQQGGGAAGATAATEHKHKKQRSEAQAQAPGAADGGAGNQGSQVGSTLTKAQKKNLKRDQRRRAAKLAVQPAN